MNKLKRTVVVAAAACSLCFAFSGCAKNDSGAGDSKASSSSSAEASKDAASGQEEEPGAGADALNSRPEECGLSELSGPESSVGPFNVSVKYFQPGEMVPSPNSTMWMHKYAESQMHLEVDTKANEFGTNWGYSVDETPANLHMMYTLEDADGKALEHDMMMEMNAIDGSHYGTNLKKGTIEKPGTYKLRITIYPPIDYDLHTDYITGVPAEEWFKPLTTEMEWKITQEDLDKIAEATVADPMAVPEKCKAYPKKKVEDAAAQKAMEEAENLTPVPMKH